VLRQLASSNGVNSSCAHFAAVRGFVDVLDALLEGTRDWDDNSATLYASEATLAAQDAPLITYRPATWALLLYGWSWPQSVRLGYAGWPRRGRAPCMAENTSVCF